MQKTVKNMKENYICSQKAIRKLRSARKFRTPLYLYGVTGIGKTSLVLNNLRMKHCSYYSAAQVDAEEIMIKEQTSIYTVIIDDLHCVSSVEQREAYCKKIGKLLERENIWLILIARCPFPRWLLEFRTKYIFIEIPEEDFLLSREEQTLYLEQFDLHISEEIQQEVWELARGNPMPLLFLVMEKGDLERGKKRQWDFLETHVYDQWNIELQEFFMDVSIVETFTVKLAAMLTGRSDVEKLIAEAEVTGNFFEISGIEGIWKCRWAMRQSMQQRLHRRRTTEQIQKLYYTAGLYYELENQIPQALSMYEKYNDMESISRLLISNARKNPSSGHYYELRRYYLQLPDDIVENSPVLMAGISLLQSMLMNVEESERWFHALERYVQKHTGGLRKEARSRILYLKIALPHTGTIHMIDILKNADLLLRSRQTFLPEFSVTSNLPSMMNGGKDFCEWSKKDKELAMSIGKIVEFVLGKYGKGLVNLALAESYLEKGEDSFEIFSYAEKILLSLRKRAKKEAPNLLANLDTFVCRVHLYQGRDVSKWMEQSPNENQEFCTMERFQYLTKVRIYIQMRKYEAAYCLLQQILYYAKMMERTYIYMEATLLLAITQYCMKQEEWKDNLQKCISQAEGYHFVRLFMREGPVVLSMIENEKFIWKNKDYKRQVLLECNQMKKAYPLYLKCVQENQVVLSKNAVKILKLQAEGMSANAIAEHLKIAEATVKYHNRETYRKLGVKNKTAAIVEARKRRLI